jgi:hypothetical protein
MTWVDRLIMFTLGYVFGAVLFLVLGIIRL